MNPKLAKNMVPSVADVCAAEEVGNGVTKVNVGDERLHAEAAEETDRMVGKPSVCIGQDINSVDEQEDTTTRGIEVDDSFVDDEMQLVEVEGSSGAAE